MKATCLYLITTGYILNYTLIYKPNTLYYLKIHLLINHTFASILVEKLKLTYNSLQPVIPFLPTSEASSISVEIELHPTSMNSNDRLKTQTYRHMHRDVYRNTV